ncbi:MAG TPA: hypothetical protein DF712_20335 [Balneola sp.]|nr:hypothetical protein [Balneola sp.]|tara:strand:- start:191 stop:598 length:408 start_codon:yes stop_codon:yes gene_type:complete
MIQALLPSLLPAVTNIVGRFLPEDKEARAKAEREIKAQLTTHLAKIDIAQLEINKQEAAHRSIFVAGWRPFIGWTCGIALAYTYVLQPILVFGLAQGGYLVDLPKMELGEMMPVLMGMLGLGGLRTFEKFKGVSK